METIVNEYISRELVSQPDLLPLRNDTPLLEHGILDSLSLLKLVLFLEERFGVEVAPKDLVPEHFGTIESICTYLRAQHQMQEVQG